MMIDGSQNRDSIHALARACIERAIGAGVTLACVESCTGGLIGAALTHVPGSSAAFVGGMLTYSNDAKQGLAGVDAAMIETHGAVSAEVSGAMARGGLGTLGVDRCVAVSGVAGPGGGSDDKPVGTVWIALATRGTPDAQCVRLLIDDPRSRERVRARSVLAALAILDPEYDESALPHEQERRRIGTTP